MTKSKGRRFLTAQLLQTRVAREAVACVVQSPDDLRFRLLGLPEEDASLLQRTGNRLGAVNVVLRALRAAGS